MKIKAIMAAVLAMAAASCLVAFAQEQMTTEEKSRQFYQDQDNKLRSFMKSQYAAEEEYLMDMLKPNVTLTDAQKIDLVKSFLIPVEEREVEPAILENHIANVVYLEQVANDQTMNIEQKKEAVRKRMRGER